MSLRVVRAGLQTTIQDLGRPGWQQYGVSSGGAMDPLSLRVANLLVGNEPHAACLEMTLLGPSLEFDDDALVAICGGDLGPHVEDERVPQQRPVWLRAGSQLQFGPARSGCRAYLAISGGVDVPVVLGSRSTYLQASVGGLKGRPLQAGDRVAWRSLSEKSQRFTGLLRATAVGRRIQSVPWGAPLGFPFTQNAGIRAIRGPEFGRLSSSSQTLLFGDSFEVSTESDRMGYRLRGSRITLSQRDELLSAAVCAGTIQVPFGGQPIVLLADCATTGGYAKVAVVASVDLPRMAQLKPGDRFSLQEISLEEAHQLYRDREVALRCLTTSLRLKRDP